jgi:antirestriction protein ArdC
MTRESLDTIVSGTFDTLVAQLEVGQSDALRQHLAAAARFHHYSWRNQLLIASQRPTATRVAGFQTWKQLGRWVRKGEHGIVIIAPIVRRGRREDSHLTVADDDESRIAGFRAAYVFDVAQTEGTELPELGGETTGDPGAWLEALEQAIRAAGVTLVDAVDLEGAQGASTPGRIEILSTLSPVDRFCTLAHEYGHELLHQRGERPSSKTVRETEAEAVAFIVAAAIGVTPGLPSHDYISLYNGSADTLRESLTRIQRTAAAILDALGIGPVRQAA